MPAPPQEFVIVFGPPAVGKMTVAYALAQRTGFRVFHNHMTVDLVLPFFEFGTPAFGRLVGEFRDQLFAEVARSALPGLIFTYVWALDDPGDDALVRGWVSQFQERGWRCAFVELEATLDERLRRNRTPFRLEHKPSKRDVDWSDRNLRELDGRYRLNTAADFTYPERFLKLHTTNLSADAAAAAIVTQFGYRTVVGI
jgi:hypothetical protein